MQYLCAQSVRVNKAEAGPSSNGSEAAGKPNAPVPERFGALGLSREVAIFTRQDLEATSAGIRWAPSGCSVVT